LAPRYVLLANITHFGTKQIMINAKAGERFKDMNNYIKYTFVALALTVSCLVAVYYAQAHARADSEYRSDLLIAKFAGAAMNNYVFEHGGRLPNCSNWEESIKPYRLDEEYTVLVKEHPGNRLAMNSKLSSVNVHQISFPDNTVLLYETHSSIKDASGLPPWRQSHQCGISTKGWRIIVFASGRSCSSVEGSSFSYAP